MTRFILCNVVSALVLVSVSAQVIHVPGDQATIQQGIDIAATGDTVLVAEGSYLENINFNGKAITVASHYVLDMDEAHIANTVIDGSQPAHHDTASVVTLWSGEDTTSVLIGFTITGGKGTVDTETFNSVHGAGILIINSGGKICNNIIENNALGDSLHFVQVGFGCAATLNSGNNYPIVFRDNVVRNNITRGENVWAGAVGLDGGGILVEGNAIYDNENIHTPSGGQNWGGGICFLNSETFAKVKEVTVIRNNVISRNKADGGAGIGGHGSFNAASYRIYNNLISENESVFGGAFSITESTNFPEYEILVYNNTIMNNSASLEGNSVALSYTSFVTLFNNIIWSNVDNGLDEIYIYNGQIELYNNIIESPPAPYKRDNYVCEGNTYLEPTFVPETYRLAEGSSAIGRAVDSVQKGSTWYYAPLRDMDGNVRPNARDEHMDLGAYESEFGRSLSSTARLVDLYHYDYYIKPTFYIDSMKYSVEVVDTCTALADFYFAAEDYLADIQIDPAADITSENVEDRTTSITVNSSDGSTQLRYNVEFNALSSNAKLDSLVVMDNYSLVPEFDPEILRYEVALPDTVTQAPGVHAVPADKKSGMDIKDANFTDLNNDSETNRTTSIIVEPEAGRRYKDIYKVVFVPIISVHLSGQSAVLKVFPNPFHDFATLEIEDRLAVEKILLVDILGKTVRSFGEIPGNTLVIEKGELPSGLYFLQVWADELYVLKVLIE